MKRWLKWTLVVVAVLLLVVVAFVAKMTHDEGVRLVTNPHRQLPGETPADYGLTYEDVTVTTADGLNLVGWYLPSQNGAAVIAQHGFLSDRGEHLQEAAFLQENGYGVLVATTRCHDGSEGEVITWGRDEMADLEAWYQYLLTRDDVQADRIGMFGISFGGIMSTKYAAENQAIRAVIAQSSFVSLEAAIDIAIGHYVELPPPFDRLLGLLTPMIVFWAEQEADMDVSEVVTLNWIAEISPRALFIQHGGKDDYVGPDAGRELYDAAGDPKEYWFEPEVGHANFDEVVPMEVYEERVVSFFDRHLLAD